MIMQLTPQEAEGLIFEPGDIYEVISGTVTFTASQVYRLRDFSEPSVMKTFMFEATDRQWGTQEWQLSTQTELPNGPALLVLLRRGDTASVFGMVSMVNRTWTHVLPFAANALIENSSKFKALNRGFVGRVAAAAVTGGLLSMIPLGGLFLRKVASAQAQPIKQSAQVVITAARHFMFRIMSNAEQLWDGGTPAMSGHL